MNDLNGRCVNVVLAVEMGRGMSFIEHPVKIVANFHGRSLESDLIEPSDCPIFNTELVWEIEKKELRKLRSTNTHLRTEVMIIDNNQRKDRIGFVLLSPKCAKIIPSNSQIEIPFYWQKLLGVTAENKSNHPELYLSLTIRDLEMAIHQQATGLTVEEGEIEDEVEKQFEVDGKTIPIEYLQDGFIQIGINNCEKYLLNILIQVAYNLDLLLPNEHDCDQDRAKYFISFRMFGITIKSKPFCRDLHANIAMNEKIVIRILSHYNTLHTYLSEHCQILMCFYSGNNKLGFTNLPVNMLIKHLSNEEFLKMDCISKLEQKCFFKYVDNYIVPTGLNNRQPYIEIVTTLQGIESNPLVVESLSVQNIESFSIDDFSKSHNENVQVAINKIEEIISPRETVNRACGDKMESVIKEEDVQVPTVTACGDQNLSTSLQRDLISEELLNVCENIEDNIQIEETDIAMDISKSIENICKEPPLYSESYVKEIENLYKPSMLYQQYCLDVIIVNITLKKKIKSEKLCIKLKHPKASSNTTIVSEIENRIGEDIILENTRCKMFFISTEDHIRKMVYAWPPKLILADENNQNLIEELDIYTAMFLAKDRIECSYITECKALRTYEPLAVVSIMMFLQQYGLSALPQQTKFDLLPTILDENIAIKELRELQEWKENEKVKFSVDLKMLQKQHMDKMKIDWSKKRIHLEETLKKSVARCEDLSQELQRAINAIKTKKVLEQKAKNADEIDSKYNNKTYFELTNIISKLEVDNANLKTKINSQNQQIQQIKKTALTKEQTGNLLQQLKSLEEKLQAATKAKTYFKEQWQKAVKEIHDLKSEDYKQIKEKIQNQKTELSHISLEGFASDPGIARFDYEKELSSDPLQWENPIKASTSYTCNRET